MSFIFAPQNAPFAIALSLMALIAIFEGAAALIGAGLSEVLDSLIPDFDPDLSASPEAPEPSAPNALSRLLGWLYVGKLPLLMLLVILLTVFGLIGYAGQYLVSGVAGTLLPAPIAAVPALLVSLPVVRVVAGGLQRIMPKDETSAVSTETFIGHTAVITLGTAREDLPAEARVTDRHGTNHYVRVVPETGQAPIAQGQVVLLVRQTGSSFVAIISNDPKLVDSPSPQ